MEGGLDRLAIIQGQPGVGVLCYLSRMTGGEGGLYRNCGSTTFYFEGTL